MSRPIVRIEPRTAVLRRLAAAHDRFSEAEQLAVGEGRHKDAQVAHEYALWTLRAYRAEQDDRKPKGPA